uniref:Uncharacterized protein n=1 Tax=Sphaerodactylus townsendi TaxID=933632 RepID=A0ACB8FG07_9SAUR
MPAPAFMLAAMDRNYLIDVNENLKTEIWDLREIATNLDLEKQEIILENQSIKELNRSLEAKNDCFQGMAEDFCNEEEDLRAKLLQLEETLVGLDFQNQALQETNQMLRAEIQTASRHVDSFLDYQVIQEEDLSRTKQVVEDIMEYFRSLESKVGLTERLYEEEKLQVAELTHTLEELEQIQEVQENEMASLKGQLEEAALLKFQSEEDAKPPSLLHEMVQAKLMQDSLATQKTVFRVLSKLLWFLLAATTCVGLMSASVKLCVFMFGKDLGAGSRWLWVLDQSLQLLLEALSPYGSRKPSGLKPF